MVEEGQVKFSMLFLDVIKISRFILCIAYTQNFLLIINSAYLPKIDSTHIIIFILDGKLTCYDDSTKIFYLKTGFERNRVINDYVLVC